MVHFSIYLYYLLLLLSVSYSFLHTGPSYPQVGLLLGILFFFCSGECNCFLNFSFLFFTFSVKNAMDFCVIILCPATVLYSLIISSNFLVASLHGVSFTSLLLQAYLYFGGTSQVELVVKKLPTNAGDMRDAGLIPGSGRSLRGVYENSLWYFCLENPMGRGAWWATVNRVTKSQIWLKQLNT